MAESFKESQQWEVDVDWIVDADFSDAQTRSLVAAMREMSAIDGHVDEQEQELIDLLVDDLEPGECTLNLSLFVTPAEQSTFLRLVAFVAIVDTTVNDAEWNLLQSYIEQLGADETPQGLIDFVGAMFLNQVFADAELGVWLPQLSQDLRLSDDTVSRLQNDT